MQNGVGHGILRREYAVNGQESANVLKKNIVRKPNHVQLKSERCTNYQKPLFISLDQWHLRQLVFLVPGSTEAVIYVKDPFDSPSDRLS